jgi:hypothetical protein
VPGILAAGGGIAHAVGRDGQGLAGVGTRIGLEKLLPDAAGAQQKRGQGARYREKSAQARRGQKRKKNKAML